MPKKLAIVCLLLCSACSAFGKWTSPAAANPITTESSRIDYEMDRKNCESNKKETCEVDVFLVSKDLKTEKVSWKSELYKKEFKPGVETGSPKISLKSLKLRKTHVVARDDRNHLYVVDLNSGALIRPKQPIVYSAE